MLMSITLLSETVHNGSFRNSVKRETRWRSWRLRGSHFIIATKIRPIIIKARINELLSYHIVDLKRQNHLKVGTQKRKLKVKSSEYQMMMSGKDLFKSHILN